MTDLLTVKDVAKILGLSTNTVYKYLNSGAIRSNRANLKQGRFRVSKKAVEEFLGAPLEELESLAEKTPQVTEVIDTITVESVVSPQEDGNRTAHSASEPDMAEKYETLLKSLVLDDETPTDSPKQTKEAVNPAGATPPPQEEILVKASPPTFALKATRLLLLLGLVLFVVNLAYFSVPHPIALFTQLSILFLFILLTYQYGGMKRRTT